MEDYKEKYEQALERAKVVNPGTTDYNIVTEIFPELKESKDEKLSKLLHKVICHFVNDPQISFLEREEVSKKIFPYIEELEKQGEQKPAFCHHEVDFSGCSEEYRKAYYDGWNNCNQQHDQLEAEQKSTWSEEDEKMWVTISDLLWEGFKLSDKKVSWDKIRCWLLPKITYFKDRVQTNPKQEWSEKDEKLYTWCASAIQTRYNDGLFTMDEYRETSLWLKSLKERLKGE